MEHQSVTTTFNTENAFGSGSVISWASIMDDNARKQAEAISRVPIVDGHVAIMPDVHFGFGPPVGSAIVTKGGVMPYAVGVDIGCGMIAVQTSLEREQLRGFEGKILGEIRERIPSGVGTSHEQPTERAHTFLKRRGTPPGIEPSSQLTRKGQLLAKDYTSLKARLEIQFGTLGSGNHFVEVCEDLNGIVWLLLHSGSRGIGNILATAHVQRAKAFVKDNGIKLESAEFAYFIQGSEAYGSYVADMEWAQDYAFKQREAMMDALLESVGAATQLHFGYDGAINCHHNYATARDDGSILTRKGAINAEAGKPGIIPGSMGAATYIVEGLGDQLSYETSPHGAGRMRGRSDAKKHLSVEDFKTQMAGKTWLDRDADQLLDEAPDAYKDIEVVMADSADLVKPLTKLSQFINYKGVR
jgi:tRNA-splicing ligase RtcB